MTFLKALQAHRGGLIRLKTQLYWHDGRGPEGVPGRICLLLDATVRGARLRRGAATPTAVAAGFSTDPDAAILLLIDGAPHWVWVGQEDVEIL